MKVVTTESKSDYLQHYQRGSFGPFSKLFSGVLQPLFGLISADLCSPCFFELILVCSPRVHVSERSSGFSLK